MIDVQSRILDYVGCGMLILVCLVFLYGMIYVCDIPYEIARKRNHPHQDAIFVAGWVSLVLLHVMWPLLWVWAMMHKPDLPPDEVFAKRTPAPEKETTDGEA